MTDAKEEWSMTTPVQFPIQMPLGEIAKALAAAQAEMQNPGFDSTNPHFRNKFASLAAVRNAVVPVLAKHGISMCQDLATADGGVSCTTILTHSSGQQMKFGPLSLPASKADAQGYGSAATYARRYALMAVAGVVGDEDDDANSATGKPAPAQAYEKPHNPAGDLGKNVPEDKARDTATAMIAIMEQDIDEAVMALRVYDKHEVLTRDPDLYQAASQQMSAKQRNAWKTFVSLAKSQKDRPMNATGRAA